MVRTCQRFNDDIHMTIELPAYFYRNCALKYKCKADWESMEKADDEDYELVRTCSECNEKVHLAEDDVSMRFHVESNNCIVIPLALTEYYPYIEDPLFPNQPTMLFGPFVHQSDIETENPDLVNQQTIYIEESFHEILVNEISKLNEKITEPYIERILKSLSNELKNYLISDEFNKKIDSHIGILMNEYTTELKKKSLAAEKKAEELKIKKNTFIKKLMMLENVDDFRKNIEIKIKDKILELLNEKQY